VKSRLADVSQPAIVFCHHPIDDQPIEGNPLFEEHPEWAAVENRIAVREALLQSGKVVTVVTGHVHWNRAVRIGGVPFLTIQCLVESWTTGGEPTGAYGKLWIEPQGRLRLEVQGRDGLEVEMECSEALRSRQGGI
jgi:hypothetical protein